MGEFEKKVLDMAPVVKDVYEDFKHILIWENADKNGSYWQRLAAELGAVSAWEKEGGERRILVSDSDNLLRKAAMALAADWRDEQWQQAELEGAWSWEDDEDEENDKPHLMQIDIPSYKISDQAGKVSAKDDVLFLGLHEGILTEEYRRMILSCKAGCSYVGIRKELLTTPFIMSLIYEGNYEVLELPEVGKDSLAEFAAELLEACGKSDAVKKKDLQMAVSMLQKKRGTGLSERDIARFLDMAETENWDFQKVLHYETMRTWNDLEKMLGLEELKKLARRRIALFHGAQRNPLLQERGRHYLFVGNPGTGKTEGARFLHEVLMAEGCVGGRFVMASREEIVGSYVGQTAPKVAELFQKAAGGVLFIDEAGFFLERGSGGYIHEAMKEFVRFMELRRDVTVIFALYPGEKNEFLHLDAGLTSRISQVVEFPDYDVDMLCKIGEGMWKEQGYLPERGSRSLVETFLTAQKKGLKECFGNAREMRKLVELSIEEAELRLMEEEAESPKKGLIRMKKQDISNAAKALAGRTEKKESEFGFQSQQEPMVRCEAV